MKYILAVLLVMGMCTNVWSAEYWVDNKFHKENIETGIKPTGLGTEKSPFSKVASIEALITPMSSHTINLIGTNSPYEGGLGGHGLKKWIYGNCTINLVENDTEKVVFYATRSIPIDKISGLATAKKIQVPDKLQMEKYRLIKDGAILILVRPDKYKDMAGYSYSKKDKEITINTTTINTVGSKVEVIK